MLKTTVILSSWVFCSVLVCLSSPLQAQATKTDSAHILVKIAQKMHDLPKEQQIRWQENRKQEQKIVYFLSILATIFFILLVSGLYYMRSQVHKTQKILREKNQEIAQYARVLEVTNEELEHKNELIVSMNENLQRMVRERTQSLESAYKKLSHYSFSNSHIVRRPLANILGLVYLLDTQKEVSESNKEILKLIQQNAEELDAIIRTINDSLEESSIC